MAISRWLVREMGCPPEDAIVIAAKGPGRAASEFTELHLEHELSDRTEWTVLAMPMYGNVWHKFKVRRVRHYEATPTGLYRAGERGSEKD
jgi:hypothetical protein